MTFSEPSFLDPMKLFLLRWNPAISSWKDVDFRKALAACRAGSDCVLNWSIRDWDKVERGDWALLCRVGCGDDDGIVMAGRFTGAVFEEDSWHRDGTKCHYADADMVFVNDPAVSGLIGAVDLERIAPGVDWRGGHSGVLVPQEGAEMVAAFLAETLARLDDPHKVGFATTRNRGETVTWLTACSLLSDLCPTLKSVVFAQRRKSSALEFPRLVEEGCELYFDARELKPGVPFADILQPVSWDGVLRVSESGPSGIDLIPVDRRRHIKRPPPECVPDSRSLHVPDGREIRLEKGSLFEIGKDEIEGLAIFLPCGLTALRNDTESFLAKYGVPLADGDDFVLFSANSEEGHPLRRIACFMNGDHRLYTLENARRCLQDAFSCFEKACCRVAAMNGFRMDADSEQRTLSLVRNWFSEHPNSSIRKVYLIDKRTGFKSAK